MLVKARGQLNLFTAVRHTSVIPSNQHPRHGQRASNQQRVNAEVLQAKSLADFYVIHAGRPRVASSRSWRPDAAHFFS